eukprot:CAMPEP_0113402606 /NCGR_PEP_ID=MMETSP0013_2-20120614/17359_1 /TAXON_ID=2843 ORGANISM="Skeletonema costatum, Strain 1716" /NCGR_SAMPLE_ID=MMETSP0013_2 /ASSEMBLY_ACC=CAM_ASM_000158 /LENGTH=1110 /DNA_ID=CAMNT_0000287979 /DNA_START=254 /DNA_END=3583 /DNA_ORIENTATION=+ /assembly_acc=CAM_ASM_000158
MSTILATLLVPAVTASSSLLRPRSTNSSSGQLVSMSIRSLIADTAKRRKSSTITNNNSSGGRWSSLAFVNPSSSSRHLTTNNNNNNKPPPCSNNHKFIKIPRVINKPRLPWTPICETHIELFTTKHPASPTSTSLQMMNPNLPSEGFRDAHRGGQDYIQRRGEDGEEGGATNTAAAAVDGTIADTAAASSASETTNPPPTTTANEQHLFQQRQPPQPPQSQQLEGGGYSFPKLSPGRQRNYKSPMTEASSALQQSFRRKNVVSSLERVVYNPREQQSVGQRSSNGESSQLQPPAVQETINNTNINIATSTSSIQVEPSKAENFRDDVRRFKASGSDGYTSEQLQEKINGISNNNNQGVVSPNSVLPAVDSSVVPTEQQLPPAVSTTTTTNTPSDTVVDDDIINESSVINDKNDPLKGKSNQYYERVGPQSMNFRDGSRMNTYKDKAFVVATVPADDVVEDDQEDEVEDDQEELDDIFEESDDDDVVAVNGGSLLIDDVEVEEEELMMEEEEDDDDLMMEEEEEEDDGDEIWDEDFSVDDNDDIQFEDAVIPTATTSDKQNITIPSNDMDTSELSLDPKFIDFLPSDQVKEEEDLLLDEDNNINEGEGAEPYISTQLLKARLHDLLEDTENGSFVKMFRGSASYIANHRGTIAVYHIPGELLAWEGFPGLMDDIALTWLLGMKIVLVAGCRHQIDLRLEEDEGADRGYSGKVMMSSIRVTDEDTLRVVKEEAGFVRFEIERRLAKSLRLHGGLVKGSESLVGNVVSGNFYSAQPFGVIDGIDYCWTGFPRKVEVERIRQVHETNDIVLLTSLGVSPSGEIFNVNSEFLAASVAGAVSASKIVYFNVHGTLFQNKNTNKPVQNLRASDAKNLLTHYNMKIHPKGFALVDLDGNSPQQQVLRTPGSMETLIKVGYSMVALEKGVKRAHILAPENGALVQELYTRDGCGTLISRDLYEGIRRADVNDVSGIYDLIDPLVRAGTLVPRPKSKLEKEITGYYVYTRDGLIVATGQLKRFEGGFAEIGCLVVNKDYRKGGRGDAMLGYLERLSLQCGARKVFVLSTQTMDWFIERGFREVSVESLPPSRQALYNKKRKSKIYMKEIDGERDLDAAEL